MFFSSLWSSCMLQFKCIPSENVLRAATRQVRTSLHRVTKLVANLSGKTHPSLETYHSRGLAAWDLRPRMEGDGCLYPPRKPMPCFPREIKETRRPWSFTGNEYLMSCAKRGGEWKRTFTSYFTQDPVSLESCPTNQIWEGKLLLSSYISFSFQPRCKSSL